jgi:hypothetical protein
MEKQKKRWERSVFPLFGIWHVSRWPSARQKSSLIIISRTGVLSSLALMANLSVSLLMYGPSVIHHHPMMSPEGIAASSSVANSSAAGCILLLLLVGRALYWENE